MCTAEIEGERKQRIDLDLPCGKRYHSEDSQNKPTINHGRRQAREKLITEIVNDEMSVRQVDWRIEPCNILELVALTTIGLDNDGNDTYSSAPDKL